MSTTYNDLAETTEIFDACGAYVGEGDDAVSVPYGSENSDWNNAVNFFNWYGIPEMEGFGVIIIND